uniref:Cas1_AcylT domain-containing protein n=1 Tax=Heterorhabditis bacteriophora TaxID=37862 RepID=A0A1I7X2N7_HETBA
MICWLLLFILLLRSKCVKLQIPSSLKLLQKLTVSLFIVIHWFIFSNCYYYRNMGWFQDWLVQMEVADTKLFITRCNELEIPNFFQKWILVGILGFKSNCIRSVITYISYMLHNLIFVQLLHI